MYAVDGGKHFLAVPQAIKIGINGKRAIAAFAYGFWRRRWWRRRDVHWFGFNVSVVGLLVRSIGFCCRVIDDAARTQKATLPRSLCGVAGLLCTGRAGED